MGGEEVWTEAQADKEENPMIARAPATLGAGNWTMFDTILTALGIGKPYSMDTPAAAERLKVPAPSAATMTTWSPEMLAEVARQRTAAAVIASAANPAAGDGPTPPTPPAPARDGALIWAAAGLAVVSLYLIWKG